jgi:hypothetical protein
MFSSQTICRASCALLLVLSNTSIAETMSLDKQILLSAVHHGLAPHVVIRASNGDLVVAGSNNELGYRPWATRISPNGDVRWEFVEGESDKSADRSIPQQHFSAVIELPDQTTVFCGMISKDKRSMVILDHLNLEGTLINQRLVAPARPLTIASCARWQGGIVLAGSVFGQPQGTGWLAKINAGLTLEWEKYDDSYANSDIMETDGGTLTVVTWSGSINYLAKIAPSGDVLVRSKPLPEGDYKLVHTASISSTVEIVGTSSSSTMDTQFLQFDDQLRGPNRSVKLHNVGIKTCLALADGSIAIFGSQFHNGATAAVTRIYKDGSSKGFLVEPPYRSPWYEDATLTGNRNQVAAVRSVGPGQAVLDWISFK